MEGRRPIVLMLRNHNFHEHDDELRATLEAQRLSRVHLAECVVYVPVRTVHPPVPLRVEQLPRDGGPGRDGEMAVTDGEASSADETPFRFLADGGPETKITRAAAYKLVTDVLRAWPGEGCPWEALREEAIARHGSPSLTLSAFQFRRVLADMHRAGIITASDGFVSLVEQP